MLSTNKFDNKTQKNGLGDYYNKINSKLEKLIDENKKLENEIQKFEKSIKVCKESKETIIKEISKQKANYNIKKNVIDLKREFLLSIVSNQKQSIQEFENISHTLQEKIQNNSEIFKNILEIKDIKNQLLSKNF